MFATFYPISTNYIQQILIIIIIFIVTMMITMKTIFFYVWKTDSR